MKAILCYDCSLFGRLSAKCVQNKARDDRWEVLLEEVFDRLDGESLFRVNSVCISWRDACRAQPCAAGLWKRLITKDFSVPIAESGELLLSTAQPNSSEPPRWEKTRLPTSASPAQEWSEEQETCLAERNKFGALADKDALQLAKVWCTLSKRKGWWATDGLEAMDYCGKFYKAQVIGFDTRPWEAARARGDAIAPRLPVALAAVELGFTLRGGRAGGMNGLCFPKRHRACAPITLPPKHLQLLSWAKTPNVTWGQ